MGTGINKGELDAYITNTDGYGEDALEEGGKMKAKDTVVELIEAFQDTEIAWGRDNLCLFMYKAGIREVVEWLKLHPYYRRMFSESPFEWQAKLKEWGIK